MFFAQFSSMKYAVAITFFSIFFVLSGCRDTYPKAENAFDAGREFIDATLKGDWERAGAYLEHNPANDARLQQMEGAYKKKSSAQKQQYYGASINVLEEKTISNSEHIISYQNSYDKIARKVKVLRTGDGWLVDLSYSFSDNL